MSGNAAVSTRSPLRSEIGRTRRDLWIGFQMWPTWLALARFDITTRYRSSLLGPFWQTLNTLLFVLAVGGLFSRVYGNRPGAYTLYLAVGYVLWQFVSALIADACTCFRSAQAMIQQVPLPLSVHAFRVVTRNLMVLGHTALVVAGVLIFVKAPLHWNVLEAAGALCLLCLNGVWLALLLGALSLRFHDIPHIVATGLQFAFFVTPVFWQLDAAADLRRFAALNPLFAAIDVIRAPLLGAVPQPTSWTIFLGTTVLGCTLAFAAFVRLRKRIPYWV
jgi:ABC-2 type transport system permease protein/lipopolysaccharide transport system permease protein